MPIDQHGETVHLTERDEDGKPIVADGRAQQAEVRVVCEGESAIRVILDPWDGDHDLLIECHGDKWSIIFHPSGQDPFCMIDVFLSTIYHPRQTVVLSDDKGNVLKEEEW